MAYKLNMTNRLGFPKGSMFTPSPTEAGDLLRQKNMDKNNEQLQSIATVA